MTADQIITLLVLAGTLAAFIFDKGRVDLVALSGAAVLLLLGVVEPWDVQRAFASPAIIALASLFVLGRALELTGVLRLAIIGAARLVRRFGRPALIALLGMVGASSAFVNNTPVVMLAAPVVRDMAHRIKLDPRQVLIPLSYISIMAGSCTLIGTSTNLIVDDMAEASGLTRFGIFEITPVGLTILIAGVAYMALFGWRLLPRPGSGADDEPAPGAVAPREPPVRSPLRPVAGAAALAMFALVILVAAMGWAPIAAAAFAGAVTLVLLRIISLDEAYSGLKPEILLLIAGMLVIGLALETTGLARTAIQSLTLWVAPFHPIVALAVLYLVTLFLTEVLSNAGVAVLVTPLAVALGQSLYVDPRPFVVAVMMAASAAFATPVGYQTNAIVYSVGRYRYMDFVRVGVPLNFVTWAAGMWAIPTFFPFNP